MEGRHSQPAPAPAQDGKGQRDPSGQAGVQRGFMLARRLLPSATVAAAVLDQQDCRLPGGARRAAAHGLSSLRLRSRRTLRAALRLGRRAVDRCRFRALQLPQTCDPVSVERMHEPVAGGLSRQQPRSATWAADAGSLCFQTVPCCSNACMPECVYRPEQLFDSNIMPRRNARIVM